MVAAGCAPVALVILDGWGLAPDGPGNAVRLARTPTFDRLVAQHPHATLAASGLDVGLPEGQMGNSEVGHLNLGAGRVVYQDLTRIDRAITDGTFQHAHELVMAADRAAAGRGVLHIVGLCSFGGVHSNLRHVVELVRLAVAHGVPEVLVHAITDGRDVSPTASLDDMPWLERQLAEITTAADGRSIARVATVVGRYWAMDRDRRWDRTQRAWELLVHGAGAHADSAAAAVRSAHEAGVTDEFVEPYVVGDGGVIEAADPVLFANFRPDRMRQLARALAFRTFDAFDRGGVEPVQLAVCMCEYDAELDLPVAFASRDVTDTLADVLERAGVGQLHVAETEKYAHVTYFFNGGVEREHEGEHRALAPSPRDVPTYDHKPEMAAAQVADLFCAGIADPRVAFGVVNFANPDMVGHTGVIPAAITACEAADAGLARVVAAVQARGGTCIVTADHGNAEEMLTADGAPQTAHTTNLVPVVVVAAPGSGAHVDQVRDGRLADVAPTVLDLLGIAQPAAMDGRTLLQPT